MKKQPFSLLFAITLLFSGFILGFLLGRGFGSDPVLVSIPEAMQTRPAFTEEQQTPITFPIDLNKADKAALMALPGIGETLALRILAYRRERGSFRSIDDLSLVDGITQTMIEQLQTLVTLGG